MADDPHDWLDDENLTYAEALAHFNQLVDVPTTSTLHTTIVVTPN